MTGNISYTDALVQQPKALTAMAGRMREQLASAADVLAARQPVFVGIGASYAVSAVAVHALQRRGIPASRVTPGQLPETAPAPGDLVVAVSQSGRSAETATLLEQWSGTANAALVNVPGTPVADKVRYAFDLGGQADSRASTLGFTGTVVGLGMLAEAWQGGTVAGDWEQVGELVAEVEPGLVEVARDLALDVSATTAVEVVACGASLASAEEGALLVREGARIPSTGWDTRSYLHGPMESAGATAHIVVGGAREAELAATLARAGHLAVLVTSESTAPAGVRVVHVPAVAGARRVVVETLFFQHLVGAMAELRGADMDEFLFNPGDTKLEEGAA